MTTSVVDILHQVLGQSRRASGNEHYFMCQFCHHYKPKFAVNIDTGRWHCWVCEKAGRSIGSLLRQLNAPKSLQQEVAQYIRPVRPTAVPITETVHLTLPDEWRPVWNATSQIGRRAHAYLTQRGVTRGDMVRYNLGYCATGHYQNRIIFPSYDVTGRLNFFTGRDFTDTSYLKYLNPPVAKDVIGFESYINWNHPVVLVEGFLDAIATRWNAIPLIGSLISPSLYSRLLTEQVPVYLALDDDAVKKTAKIAMRLIGETIPVYHVRLDGHDPSDIGFTHMQELIQHASKLTYTDVLTLKLQML